MILYPWHSVKFRAIPASCPLSPLTPALASQSPLSPHGASLPCNEINVQRYRNAAPHNYIMILFVKIKLWNKYVMFSISSKKYWRMISISSKKYWRMFSISSKKYWRMFSIVYVMFSISSKNSHDSFSQTLIFCLLCWLVLRTPKSFFLCQENRFPPKRLLWTSILLKV